MTSNILHSRVHKTINRETDKHGLEEVKRSSMTVIQAAVWTESIKSAVGISIQTDTVNTETPHNNLSYTPTIASPEHTCAHQ